MRPSLFPPKAERPPAPARLITLLLIFLFLVAATVVYLVAIRPILTPPPPNIVLLTVDSLNASHLGCYGYARATSPHMDDLAAKGVLFDNAISPTPTAASSFASLMTGQYLAVMGDDEAKDILDARYTTLAEALRAEGYRTAAMVNHGHLAEGTGFDRGFDTFHGKVGDADDTAQDALGWIKDNLVVPYFLWVHFIDPHAPYAPASPPEELFQDPLYQTGDRKLQVQTDPALDDHQSHGKIPRSAFHEGHTNLNYYLANYDGEILQVDRAIGGLVKALGETRWAENTIIVLAAGHGESLGSMNEYFCHGSHLGEELIRVPLIIHAPSRLPRGARIRGVVSLVDLRPTLLALAGIDAEGPTDGRDLLPAILGEREMQSVPALSTLNNLATLRGDRYKLLLHRDSRALELYDLLDDPEELENIVQLRGDIVLALDFLLGERLRRRPLRADLKAQAGEGK